MLLRSILRRFARFANPALDTAFDAPATFAFVAVLALALATSVRPALADWPHDPYIGNVPVCTNAADQGGVLACSDGAGGAIIVWEDRRNGTLDLYAQRVNAAGAPLWTADGIVVSNAANEQTIAAITSDGAGGAIIAWQDLRSGTSYDIYAQRLNASGASLWTANGVAVCTATNGQLWPSVVSDGAGGGIICWQDNRNSATTNSDIYAQRVSGAGAVQWTANGVAVCTATNVQNPPYAASDGAGGAVLGWSDYRGGVSTDVYAQRLNSLGAALWTLNGLLVCNATNDQFLGSVVGDMQNGAVLVWQDVRNGSANQDVYAQRVIGSGIAMWTSNGVPVCAAANNQTNPHAVSDGSGGILAAWNDQRSGTNTDVYAQRINAGGGANWTLNGVGVTTAAQDQVDPALAEDGYGGALIAWQDFRSGVSWDIYAGHLQADGGQTTGASFVAVSAAVQSQFTPQAVPDGAGGAVIAWRDFRAGNLSAADVYAQRVDYYGELGNPAPRIVSIRDVPGDQGGHVKITWNASYLDRPDDPSNNFPYYQVWRSVSTTAMLQGGLLLKRGATTDPTEAIATGKLLVGSTAAADYAWESWWSTNGAGLPTYSLVVETSNDSTAIWNGRTIYRMSTQMYGNSGYRYWYSAPDSGASVDNLGPVSPTPFAIATVGGTTRVSWAPNQEADLAGYRVYRGTSSDFAPGPNTLFSTQPDTGYVDNSAAGYVYKVTAVDVHGNESPATTFVSSGTVGVGSPAAGALAFAAPSPNPARGATTLRWTLPSSGHVRLAVFDAAGRRVRTLVDGQRSAGQQEARFDLTGDGGEALPSGLYLVRLEAAGQILTRRLASVR